ncbi:hypothetical protein GQ54DRAFT_82828 [Martensiomyces pterosporus]|nr:hypothetical protein GQ54DRAFT_82828 [Martensiomyces pterosporus]
MQRRRARCYLVPLPPCFALHLPGRTLPPCRGGWRLERRLPCASQLLWCCCDVPGLSVRLFRYRTVCFLCRDAPMRPYCYVSGIQDRGGSTDAGAKECRPPVTTATAIAARGAAVALAAIATAGNIAVKGRVGAGLLCFLLLTAVVGTAKRRFRDGRGNV